MKHNLIMMNRYCNDLYDSNRVIFCKIDYILQEFERIKNLNYDVVLIIANGDITFNDYLLSFCPNNVKHIFATNTSCYNDLVTPIPIGVEMEIAANRIGHGDINPGIFEKLPYLTGEIKINQKDKVNKIYSNFNIYTNLNFRSIVKQVSVNEPHIDFEFGITYPEFVGKVQSYQGVISPRGNGIECIRTYEVLYLNSIPIVVGDPNEYKAIYEKIYKKLPIVFLNDVEKLKDFSFIESEIKKIKNNSLESLDYNYWVDLIKKTINKKI